MSINKTKDVLLNYIKGKNLRYTRQREEIIDTFLKSNKHITVEELYNDLKKKDSRIGYATVHRTLKFATECGLANEIKIGNGKTRFERKYGLEHHDHLICINCGKFIEVRDDNVEGLQDKLAKANKFTPRWHKLEIYGTCAECK